MGMGIIFVIGIIAACFYSKYVAHRNEDLAMPIELYVLVAAIGICTMVFVLCAANSAHQQWIGTLNRVCAEASGAEATFMVKSDEVLRRKGLCPVYYIEIKPTAVAP